MLHKLLARFVDKTFIRKPFSSIYWRNFHSTSDDRDSHGAPVSEVEYYATYHKQLPFGIMYPVWLNPEYLPGSTLPAFPHSSASSSTVADQTVEQFLIKLLEKNPNCDVKGVIHTLYYCC